MIEGGMVAAFRVVIDHRDISDCDLDIIDPDLIKIRDEAEQLVRKRVKELLPNGSEWTVEVYDD